jgi:hypothetical protein
MSIPAHIVRLRAAVGHDLLLLPAVSVLPVDQAGRLLLVRHAGHDDGWAVLGGAVEPGESPAQAAVRETREDIWSFIARSFSRCRRRSLAGRVVRHQSFP